MLLSTLVVAFVATRSSNAPSVTLRYKFRVGQVRVYKFSMQMSMKSMVSGRSMPMTSSLLSTIKQTVKNVAPDGTGTLATTMTLTGGSANVKSALAASGGSVKTFTAKMSPLGKVSGLAGVSMGQAFPGVDPGQMQFENMLPSGPVKVGSFWITNVSMAALGNGRMVNTLQAIRGSGNATVAVVRSTGDLDLSKIGSAMNQSLPGAKTKGTAHMTTQFAFNVLGGYIEGLTGDTRMTMRMSMPTRGPKSRCRFQWK